SFATGLFGFDLIFCRNVLMYFDRPTAARVIGQFHRALADGGWLVVGHAEVSFDRFGQFRTVVTSGATLFQKAGDDKAATGAAASTGTASPWLGGWTPPTFDPPGSGAAPP